MRAKATPAINHLLLLDNCHRTRRLPSDLCRNTSEHSVLHIGGTRSPQDYEVIFILFRLSQNLRCRISFGNESRYIETMSRELISGILYYVISFDLQLFFQLNLRTFLLSRLSALVEPVLI